MAIATMPNETLALRGAVAREHKEWEAGLVPMLASMGEITRYNEMVARSILDTLAACLTIAVDESRVNNRGAQHRRAVR